MKDKYKTLIISCWAVLLCCFVVKLLGGNFFEIAYDNAQFQWFCHYCNKGVMYWILSILFYSVSTTLYLMAVCRFEKPKLLLVIITIVIDIIKLIFIRYSTIVGLVEFILFIIIPICYNKKNWLRSIIGVFLVLAFQIISLVTKNIGVKIINNDVFTTIIFSIDYLIMIVLYWLYSIKEDNKDGNIWSFLFRFRRQRKH
jgi:hypothetical protein